MGAKLGGKQRLIKKLLEDATGPAVCDVEATARRVGHETRPLPLTPLSGPSPSPPSHLLVLIAPIRHIHTKVTGSAHAPWGLAHNSIASRAWCEPSTAEHGAAMQRRMRL